MTHPVQVLREHTVALEAALTVCLADPAHKPVHRLRTETRRVEAQLLLLAGMPGLPEHRKQTERLRLALKRLRQAAGEVRDLDVHRKRLEEMAGKEAGDTAGAGAALPPEPVEEAVREGAGALRDHLKSKREHTARDLRDLLERHQGKAARAAEKLLTVLEPAEGTPLEEERLLRQAEAVFSHSGLLTKGPPDDLTEDELHTVRKAAKAARYLAETLPRDEARGNAAAARESAVRRFEALQECGGQWHDALELARAAKSFLGRRHELTEAVAAERDRYLQLYREALAGEAAGYGTGGRAKAKDGSAGQPVSAGRAPSGGRATARSTRLQPKPVKRPRKADAA